MHDTDSLTTTPTTQAAVEKLAREMAAADGAEWADLAPYEQEHYLGTAIEVRRDQGEGGRS